MAKTINSGANVVTTQTFTAWLDVTNEMVGAFANVISVDAETFPTGTAGVNGAFVANTLTVTTGLLTANASANVSGNLSVSGVVSIGANVVANTSTIVVGNTSVNSSINSTAIFTSGNLTVSGTINREPTITLGGVLTGNVTLTNLANGTLTAAYVNDSLELGTHTTGNYVATVTTANGISGAVATEGGTAALKVVPGNGITANSTGVHVVVSSGLSVNASSVSVNAGSGIVANSSGVHVKANTGLVSNTSGLHIEEGLDGQVLRTDGITVYWGQPLEAGDTGFIVDVTAGDGIVKTGTADTPIISVRANNGISANSSGVFVRANNGLFTNTSGLFVNASAVSVGTLPVARGGTGTTTFTSGALLKGNGTSAIQVASAADIVGQIGNTQIANAAFSNTSASATIAATANVATNTAITNDISSAVTVYPVWVDGTSGNRANKVSSTKLTFNPSTGVLTATGLSGNGSAVTSVTAAATTGTLTRGTYLTGNNFNGSANQTWAVDATAASTASKVVARDANSSFSANVVNVNVLNTSSDIQLKSNLVIIDEPIEKVKALNGYTYDRIGSLNREAGLVAQEVQSVLPEVVSQENGYLGVAYGNIVALLVEAIKDQQKQIDELKSKLGV